MSIGVAGLLGLTFLLSILVSEVPRAPRLPLLGITYHFLKTESYRQVGYRRDVILRHLYRNERHRVKFKPSLRKV